MEQNETPIQERPLPGVNIRAIAWLVGCTVTIIVTTMTGYYNLQNEVRELKYQYSSDSRFTDLNFKTVEVKINALDVEYKELAKKYDELLQKK